MRKNRPPPPSSTARIASCTGVMVISAGGGIRTGRAPATGGPPRRAAARAFGGLARVLPGRQERRQCLRWCGLDLLAEFGQAAAAQHAEHLRVAPLGAPAPGNELALDDPVLR